MSQIMPGLMKINQFNFKASGKMNDEGKPMVAKSRLRKLFERQFPNIIRNSNVESPGQARPLEIANNRLLGESSKLYNKNKNLIMGRTADGYSSDSGSDPEPSSVCLAEMVHNFMENIEGTTKCGRARCNCSNGNCKRGVKDDGEDDPMSCFGRGEACEILKSLVLCVSVGERRLLADTSRLVEAANNEAKTLCKKERCANGCLLRAVMSRLRGLGYNAGICKSEWGRDGGYPSGKHEYIDVILEGLNGVEPERLLVDIDFRSQFEIARSTVHYAAVLQKLPTIFVGKADRLQRILTIVVKAAEQSLTKKGLHIPPWRRSVYMRAKWLSPFKRTTDVPADIVRENADSGREITSVAVRGSGWGSRFNSEFELQFREAGIRRYPTMQISGRGAAAAARNGARYNNARAVVNEWQPPPVRPRALPQGGRFTAGLASMLREAGLTSKS